MRMAAKIRLLKNVKTQLDRTSSTAYLVPFSGIPMVMACCIPAAE